MYRRLFGIDKKKKMDKLTLRLLDFFFGGGGGRSLALREGWDADAVNQYSGRKGVMQNTITQAGVGDGYYYVGRGGRWL